MRRSLSGYFRKSADSYSTKVFPKVGGSDLYRRMSGFNGRVEVFQRHRF